MLGISSHLSALLACVFVCGKFAKQALFSVQVMALGSTNGEVNVTAGMVLFLGTMLAVSSSALLALSLIHI